MSIGYKTTPCMDCPGLKEQLKAVEVERDRLRKAIMFTKTTLIHSKNLSEEEFVAIQDVIDEALI